MDIRIFRNIFWKVKSSTRMRARMITGTPKKRCEVYKSRPFFEWILDFFEYFLESPEFYENAREDDYWDP